MLIGAHTIGLIRHTFGASFAAPVSLSMFLNRHVVYNRSTSDICICDHLTCSGFTTEGTVQRHVSDIAALFEVSYTAFPLIYCFFSSCHQLVPYSITLTITS